MGTGEKTLLAVINHFMLKTRKKQLLSFAVFSWCFIVLWLTHYWSAKKVLFTCLCLVGVPLGSYAFVFGDGLIDILTWIEPEVVWRMKTKQQVAALTLDDIPLLDAPSSLGEVLKVLKKHDVKATLMVMSGFSCEKEGADVEKRKEYEELLKQAVRDGHELANHMKFDRPAIQMSEKEFDEAFTHCDEYIKKLSGEDTWNKRHKRWFRPASAIWTQHMLDRAKEYKYTPVISNCFPFDTVPISRYWNPHYLTRVVRPGSVIVIHDRWHVAATLDKALPAIRAKGIKLTTLSELHRITAEEKDLPDAPSTVMSGEKPQALKRIFVRAFEFRDADGKDVKLRCVGTNKVEVTASGDEHVYSWEGFDAESRSYRAGSRKGYVPKEKVTELVAFLHDATVEAGEETASAWINGTSIVS
jgi:peptidoglycan/xylan/chitin deacetylase (PgdA/CDA1 family)